MKKYDPDNFKSYAEVEEASEERYLTEQPQMYGTLVDLDAYKVGFLRGYLMAMEDYKGGEHEEEKQG